VVLNNPFEELTHVSDPRDRFYHSDRTGALPGLRSGPELVKLASTVGAGQKPRLCSLAAGSLVGLAFEIKKAKERFGLPPDAGVISCYEAGRDGFWLHCFLISCGIDSLVGLDPTPYQSGDTHRDRGISKAGNRRVRWALRSFDSLTAPIDVIDVRQRQHSASR
jgi:hypothetical protein